MRTPKESGRPQLGGYVSGKVVERIYNYATRGIRWVATNKEIHGIYAGYRIKREGTHYLGTYDSPGELRISRSVSVAILVVDERKRPVPVSWGSLCQAD